MTLIPQYYEVRNSLLIVLACVLQTSNLIETVFVALPPLEEIPMHMALVKIVGVSCSVWLEFCETIIKVRARAFSFNVLPYPGTRLGKDAKHDTAIIPTLYAHGPFARSCSFMRGSTSSRRNHQFGIWYPQ